VSVEDGVRRWVKEGAMRVTSNLIVAMITIGAQASVAATPQVADQEGSTRRPFSMNAAIKRAIEPETAERGAATAHATTTMRVTPSKGDSMGLSILSFVMAGSQLALGVSNTNIRSNGTCKELNPAYPRSCPSKFLVTTQYINGIFGTILALTRMPQGSHTPRVVGHHANGSTSLEFKNRTQYTLSIVLKGASVKSITVSPWSSEVVFLEPGRYNETVATMGADAVDYEAVQTYTRGRAYLETYFVMK
jgi:hypothetical protein